MRDTPRQRRLYHRPTFWTLGVALTGALLGLLAGCSTVDTTPVPLDSAPPFICDQVPRSSVELITGTDDLRPSSSGAWGDDGGFRCFIKNGDGDGVLSVFTSPVLWYGHHTAEGYIASFAASDDWAQIDPGGDVAGSGYVSQELDDLTTAQWACHGNRLVVSVFQHAGGERDPLVDVSRLTVSLLPTACGDTNPAA